MKMMKLAKPIVLGIALGIAAAGCKGTKPPVTSMDKSGGGRTGTAADDIGNGGKITGGTGTEGNAKGLTEGIAFGNGHPGWTQNREALAADTVYFDYDKSTIREGEKSKVASVADYL